MKATCIRTCTVPGLGLVEKGQTVNILPEGPWEKHFDVSAQAPKESKAPKVKATQKDSFLE